MSKELDKALATLGALTRNELKIVRECIDDLLEIEHGEDSEDESDPQNNENKEPQGGRGHIELKMIRGYGPYKYMRRWKGKTLTSTYLGKAR